MKKKLFTMLIAASMLVSATGLGYASECNPIQEKVPIKETLKIDCSELVEIFCNNSASESVQQGSMTGQVVNLVNKERKANGLSSLSLDSQLAKLAQLKAEDMAKNAYFRTLHRHTARRLT